MCPERHWAARHVFECVTTITYGPEIHNGSISACARVNLNAERVSSVLTHTSMKSL